MTSSQPGQSGRRRGKQLESAILDAGWDELVETGYARLTMASIAARASTSEPVLYRRWANKDELVLASFENYRNAHPIAIPDTGNLCDDLHAQLTSTSQSLAGFFAIAAAAAFSGLLANSGLSPSEVRHKIIDTEQRPHVRSIYERAHARGEIDLTRTPESLLAMPFDLIRHDMLMELKPIDPVRISSIVDELFWPLIENQHAP